MSSANNILVIMADEHAKQVLGAYGNTIVHTPNLDRLASQGTLFENAYCNDPICVPSRASFATGRYVHQTGHWDNARPYTGQEPSWGHRLQQTGHEAVSVGKLHYRDPSDPTGFSDQILPLHILNGQGDISGIIRDHPRRAVSKLATDAGRGDSTYLQYDRDIRDAAIGWLRQAAEKPSDKPWALFVSFVCPHFPLVAPPEFFDLYPLDSLPFPTGRDLAGDHPVLAAMRENINYDSHFRDEAHIRTALAAYYGMVSFQDDNVGRLLAALEETGFSKDTVVVYTADHGDNLGNRRFWGKSNMYEESAAVPLILKGPGVPEGKRVRTNVSLVDVFPTIVEAVGEQAHPEDARLPGRSLLQIAREQDETDRTVFSEYHATAAITGIFMVRWDRYKYVHYEGYRPQLFDLESDPKEQNDLAGEPAYSDILEEGARRLAAICDPAAITAEAFADQQRRIDALGGREAVKQIKGFTYTPAPGETPVLA
ncbi:choline-sulfatase [Mycoplana sp. BE70]|uniref:sulfatase-like hydrolase/transferase n=1 Tax=Mycoplana sp. BE70 TaxID=2817775 RepID=UPI00285E7CC1|nr:sulfatase-like hydrolase/transferase [Mycoplana sp. BE70]MDR6756814.1 choline-sulfatase [Mycoplana sp. BE70]